MRLNDGACFSDSQNRLASLGLACWGIRLGATDPLWSVRTGESSGIQPIYGDHIWAR